MKEIIKESSVINTVKRVTATYSKAVSQKMGMDLTVHVQFATGLPNTICFIEVDTQHQDELVQLGVGYITKAGLRIFSTVDSYLSVEERVQLRSIINDILRQDKDNIVEMSRILRELDKLEKEEGR